MTRVPGLLLLHCVAINSFGTMPVWPPQPKTNAIVDICTLIERGEDGGDLREQGQWCNNPPTSRRTNQQICESYYITYNGDKLACKHSKENGGECKADSEVLECDD